MTTWMNTFGYKMAWLTIQNTAPEDIIRKIQLPDVQPVEWDKGIEEVYKRYGKENVIFITLEIKGWVFLVGFYLFDLNSRDGKLERLKSRMIELSSVFDETQAFATHRVSEYHHWVLAKNGEIKRCFAYSGTSGEVLYNEGKLTEAEKMFPWDRLCDYHSALKAWYPNEDDVMTIAGKWSINPQTIESADVKCKTCYLANIPH